MSQRVERGERGALRAWLALIAVVSVSFAMSPVGYADDGATPTPASDETADPAPGDAAPEPATCLVMLRSSERLVGRVDGVDERGRLLIVTDHMGELAVGLQEIRAIVSRQVEPTGMSSRLQAIRVVTRGPAEEPKSELPSSNERIFLTSGERLRGRLVAIEGETIRFEVAGAGPVSWRRGKIRQWVRDSAALEAAGSRPARPDGRDRIVLTDGSWLDGRIEGMDAAGRFVVEGAFGAAQLLPAQVQAVILGEAPDGEDEDAAGGDGGGDEPADGSATEAADGGGAGAGPTGPGASTPGAGEGVEVKNDGEANAVLVLLADGSVIGGRLVSSERAGLALKMPDGPVLPIGGVFRAIVPRASGGAAPFGWKVLVWGPHADEGDEHKKTVDYLKAALGKETDVSANTDVKLVSRLDGALEGVRALVISEPERGDDKQIRELARKAKDTITGFVEMGGTVIVIGESKSKSGFLDTLGLLKAPPDGSSVSGKQALVTESKGDPLLSGIKGGMLAQNATMCYDAPSDAIVVLKDTRGKAVVLRKRIGLGHVVMMGYDFYEADKKTQKMLGNATKLGFFGAP